MRDAPPAAFNMAAYCLAASAVATPHKAALIVIEDAGRGAPSEVWTFAEVEDAVLRVAAALADRGLAPGDRLMIRLGNTSDFALLFFGAIAAGVVALPVSSQLSAAEVAVLLDDSGAAAVALDDRLPMCVVPAGVTIMAAGEVARMIRHPRRATYAPTRADDPAFLVYTSGTTARSKGVLHAQRSAWGRRPMYRGWYGMTAADRVLHAGAFNWTFTLGTGLTDPWANGATAIVYTGMAREAVIWPRLLAATEATLFAAVPGLVRGIVKHAGEGLMALPALRHGLIAGETPPADLFDAWHAATGGKALYEALGMSEISTYVSSSPEVPRRPGTVGRVQAGRRVAILPEDGGSEPLETDAAGLLAVHRSDPGLMLGYWRRPDEEAEVMRGDWFAGGDLAVMDADGYVTHLGRANELMNAFGYRVSPLEVAAALMRHPDVAEAAAAEVVAANGVALIAGFVVPRDGREPQPEHILAAAAEVLAAYKRPREVRVVAALPRTANGKVQRKELARAFRATAPHG